MGEGGKEEDAMKRRRRETEETEEKMAGITGGKLQVAQFSPRTHFHLRPSVRDSGDGWFWLGKKKLVLAR